MRGMFIVVILFYFRLFFLNCFSIEVLCIESCFKFLFLVILNCLNLYIVYVKVKVLFFIGDKFCLF